MWTRFVSRISDNGDGSDNLETTIVLSILSDDNLSCEVRPGSNKTVVFFLGAITSVNQLSHHISILAEAMPSRDSIEVLVSVFISLVHDLLEVRFPRHVAILVEDLKMSIEGSVQDREVLVDPCKRFVSKGNIERGVARFGSSRRVDGRLVGWRDSEVFLSSLKDTDSSVVIRLGPSQMWFGSVLLGKCDGTRSIWYSSMKPKRRQIRWGCVRRGENYRKNASASSPVSESDFSCPRRSRWPSNQGSGASVCLLCTNHRATPMSTPTAIARRRWAGLRACLGCTVCVVGRDSTLTDFRPCSKPMVVVRLEPTWSSHVPLSLCIRFPRPIINSLIKLSAMPQKYPYRSIKEANLPTQKHRNQNRVNPSMCRGAYGVNSAPNTIGERPDTKTS